MHNYSVDKPVWTEIDTGHFIYANAPELYQYRMDLEKYNSEFAAN